MVSISQQNEETPHLQPKRLSILSMRLGVVAPEMQIQQREGFDNGCASNHTVSAKAVKATETGAWPREAKRANAVESGCSRKMQPQQRIRIGRWLGFLPSAKIIALALRLCK